MEVDVSDWAVIRDEPGGRDPNKRWIALHADAPRDEHWLWKSRQLTGGGPEHALTDCAEVFVSRLAGAINLPAAECRFATCDGELGVISRNVSPPGFNLNTGAAYLPEVEGYERHPLDATGASQPGRMRRDRGYTLDAVQQVLTAAEPPPGITGLDGFAVFAGYLVLDALVANSDRHPGNWAILERYEDGRRFLAPTYDHGSALGAGLTDDNRRTRSPESYARRGKANPFEPAKTSLVDLALDAVTRSGTTVWLQRVAALDAGAVRETLNAPGHRLSEVAATFIERIVLENRRRLCDDDAAED